MKQLLFSLIVFLFPLSNVNGMEHFSVENGKLLDPSGEIFLQRGVNLPSAYYYERSLNSIDDIKNLNFNTIRVVWCADNFSIGFRCQDKDFHSANDLDTLLTEITNRNLVTLLNIQNATGSDDPEDLNKIVDYLLTDRILKVLFKHQKNILLILQMNGTALGLIPLKMD